MESDPRPQSDSQNPQADEPQTSEPQVSEPVSGDSQENQESQEKQKKRILIGSQREKTESAAEASPSGRDWYVPEEALKEEEEKEAKPKQAEPAAEAPAVEEEKPKKKPVSEKKMQKPEPAKHYPPPNIRDRLPAELEAELEAALGSQSMDDLLVGSESVTQQELLEPESKHTGRVVSVHLEDIFVELGGREQGVISIKSVDPENMPEVGSELEVIVNRYNKDDGLYELTLPNAAIDVSDWSDISAGIMVEATVTGHNAGGLECEVNHIRAFMPISQISLYRVESIEEFVGEKWNCIVTEANPQRRNLVISRRAALEREREEKRQQLLDSLEPGQIHEGVVRKIMDFGAFVDLGGVDGLVHISQLGWGRVKHPGEVLTEGQTIKVKVQKIDPETKKISLGYRDMMESPWENVEAKYPINTLAKGTVSKIMDFGAFVELEPGIEGLVHISELSHKRVFRTSDVVSEGDEVDVMIQSIDTDSQRISLSMKAATAPPEPEKKEGDDSETAPIDEALPKSSKKKHKGPLKGGVGGPGGGDRFGLKW